MSPGQGHRATGLCLRFPPIRLICIVSVSSSGSHRAIPSGCVTNNHQSRYPLPYPSTFLPSNSPRRLTTYRTNWLPQRGSGPFQVRCLFHFPHFPSLVPWLPWATPSIFAQQTGHPPAFHPKLPAFSASSIRANTAASPCPTAARVPRADSAGKSFRTLSTGQQSTS